MIRLRYGNTNTYLLTGSGGSLLIDTDYAGTLPAFFREIKKRTSHIFWPPTITRTIWAL